MRKIKTLKEIAKISTKAKKQSKRVGLITGCFDILHVGHIQLFEFAKKHTDILIVGLDNDKAIKLSKGKVRPIYTLRDRAKILSKIPEINYIFPITSIYKFNNKKANSIHEKIIEKLKPDYIITNQFSDEFLEKKRLRAKKFGIKIKISTRKPSSSSFIIQKIESEI